MNGRVWKGIADPKARDSVTVICRTQNSRGRTPARFDIVMGFTPEAQRL
jgi:hypothetical protein